MYHIFFTINTLSDRSYNKAQNENKVFKSILSLGVDSSVIEVDILASDASGHKSSKMLLPRLVLPSSHSEVRLRYVIRVVHLLTIYHEQFIKTKKYIETN